jgi:hypothetical protein
MRKGFIQLSGLSQNAPKTVMGTGAVWLKFDGLS